MSKVLVLGGYGNFGKRISTALAKDGIEVIIAGRDINKAALLAEVIGVKAVSFDVMTDLDHQLQHLKPMVVINTVGPFQTATYDVAKSCIQHGVHYIDLADGRDFVTGMTGLDAKEVLVVPGASTVPGLSSAVIEHYQAYKYIYTYT